ncbi:MAG: transposase [Lysobacterales bacterium]|jgi:transposase
MKERVKYSKEFKVEAIRLLNEGEKPTSEIALQLGVKRTLLYRWRDQLEKQGEKAFTNNRGRPTNDESSEITKLRRENKELKEERDILKKAAAYFARDLK